MIRDEIEEESKRQVTGILSAPTLFLKGEKQESTEDFKRDPRDHLAFQKDHMTHVWQQDRGWGMSNTVSK